jgi:predicted nucleotidyltransferase
MNIIDICADTITREFPNVAGIWLFGSNASGTDSVASDIDMAILFPERVDKIKLWQCAELIASRVNKDIDLIDLSEASTVLRAQVMQDGKRVYCADKSKCDIFETEALTDYLRFNDERKELLADIKARGKVLSDDG